MANTVSGITPTWADDAKPADIQTEVRKAFSDMISQVNSAITSINSSLTGLGITSGSNANGSWIKFSDGTMIQFGTTTATVGTNAQVVLPISFISTSFQAFTHWNSTVTGVSPQLFGPKTISTFNFTGQLVGGPVGTYPVDWVAFGRWK